MTLYKPMGTGLFYRIIIALLYTEGVLDPVYFAVAINGVRKAVKEIVGGVISCVHH